MVTRTCDDRTLLELAGRLYDVADDLGRWPVFLRRLARQTRSGLALVHQVDAGRGGDTALAAWPVDARTQREYDQRFGRAGLNPWFASQRAVRAAVGSVFGGARIMARRRLERSPFFREFLAPRGWRYRLSVVFDRDRDLVRLLTLCRSATAGPYRRAERELLVRLAPHLGRALRIAGRLSDARRYQGVLSGAVERLPMGLLVFDRAGRLVLANQRGRDLLKERDGLSLDEAGRPRAPRTQDTERLRALLARAADSPASPGLDAGLCLTLPRPSGRRDLAAVVAPLEGLALGQAGAYAALFLSDPEDRSAPAERVLSSMWGLTPAEARLAARLVQGASVEQIAAELAITLNTARTHLKRIFRKTGTNRQGALVSLLARHPQDG